MKRIIVLTHGKLCEGIVTALDVIAQGHEGIDTISVGLSESPDEIVDMLKHKIISYDNEDTIIVATDIPAGSTTTNAIRTLSEMNEHPFHIITGLNLGMMLALALQDINHDNVNESLKDIVSQAKETIVYVNDMLGQ